jgi:hypothetical protein
MACNQMIVNIFKDKLLLTVILADMSVNFETIIKNVLDISTIDSTRYVAPYKQTRWIVGSSCLFLIPSVYGYSCEQYLLATVALLTSMFSVNFWRDATYSYRRSMDCIMAKISFIIFTVNGVIYITKLSHLISGYGALVGIIYCYFMSNKHGNSDLWWKYHMMFHVCVSFAQFISIKGTNDYYSSA